MFSAIKAVPIWDGKTHYAEIKKCLCAFFESDLKHYKDPADIQKHNIYRGAFISEYSIEADRNSVVVKIRSDNYTVRLSWKTTIAYLTKWCEYEKSRRNIKMAAIKMRETGPKVSLTSNNIGDLDRIINENSDNVVEIPITEINPFKYKGSIQPFAVRDDEVEILAESIEKYGQLTPCAVRPYKDSYQIISGHKRLAAARKLGNETLKCIIFECDDKTAFELVKHYNIQRDKPFPSEIMQLVAQSKKKDNIADGDEEKEKLTVTEIASLYGLSRKHIYRCYKLRDLPKAVQNAVDEGILGTTDIENICNMIKPEHINGFAAWVECEDKKISASKLKKIYEYSAVCENDDEFDIDQINKWLADYDDNHAAAAAESSGSGDDTPLPAKTDYFSKLRIKYEKQFYDKSDEELYSLIDALLSERFK